MAVKNQLQIGVPTTLAQNEIWALPTLRCLLFTDASSPTIKMANNVGISPSVTVTPDANGMFEAGCAFIQSTGSASIVVMLKEY